MTVRTVGLMIVTDPPFGIVEALGVVAAAHVTSRSTVVNDFLNPSKSRERQTIFRETCRLGREDDKRDAEMSGLREN